MVKRYSVAFLYGERFAPWPQAQGFNGTAGPSCVDEPVALPPEMTEAERAERLAKECAFLKEAGNRAFKEKKYVEAIQRYSRAIACNVPDKETSAVLHCNRSAALMGAKDYSYAMEDAKFAVQIRPGWHKAHLRYAAAVAALGRHGLDEGASPLCRPILFLYAESL